jgi:hypothetical protein
MPTRGIDVLGREAPVPWGLRGAKASRGTPGAERGRDGPVFPDIPPHVTTQQAPWRDEPRLKPVGSIALA